MTTHPSDWRNAPARTKWLALAAVAGIAGGIMLTTIFSGAAAKAMGPGLIARNSAGETLLANSTTLFLVAADEASSVSLPIEALGLRGPVLSVSSDGADWFVGDDASGMLYRCDLTARKCVAALQRPGSWRVFRRAHRAAFTSHRIFVTDSEAHRLLVFDRAGYPLTATRTGPLELCFPNGIVAVDEEVYVADTNNFRIAQVAIADRAVSTTFLQTSAGVRLKRVNCNRASGKLGARGMPVFNTAIDSANTVIRSARPPARPGRVWPVSVLRTSAGEWWVIQMSNRMRSGDVIRYDAGGSPLSRIPLPPGADPIELVEARGEVLITDSRLGTVHRATQQGKISGAWGPPEFQASQRHILATHDLDLQLQRLSLGIIATGVLAAMLVVLIELRRQRAQGWASSGTLGPVAIPATPLGAQTLWIPLDEEFLRQAHRSAWILGVGLLVMIVPVSYLASDIHLETRDGRVHAAALGAIAALVLLAAGLVVINLNRLSRRRLGVSHPAVLFESESGNVISAPWEEVRIGARSLLLGRQLVQIIDPRGRYLYSQQLLETQLLSRVPPAGFLRNSNLVLEALRRGNVHMWIAVLSFAIYFAFMLLKLYQPELMRGVAARILHWFS
jgi:hypothetical protein